MSTSYISYIIIGRFLGKIILWVSLVSKRSNIERSQCPNFRTNIGFAWMEISNRKYLLRWEIFFPKKFKNQYFFQWLEIYQEGKFPPSEHHWLNQNPPRPRLGWVKRQMSSEVRWLEERQASDVNRRHLRRIFIISDSWKHKI